MAFKFVWFFQNRFCACAESYIKIYSDLPWPMTLGWRAMKTWSGNKTVVRSSAQQSADFS